MAGIHTDTVLHLVLREKIKVKNLWRSMMEGTVTISKKEYFDLLMAQEKLTRLENGGVDNWDWYGESLHSDEDMDWDEFEEQTKATVEAL